MYVNENIVINYTHAATTTTTTTKTMFSKKKITTINCAFHVRVCVFCIHVCVCVCVYFMSYFTTIFESQMIPLIAILWCWMSLNNDWLLWRFDFWNFIIYSFELFIVFFMIFSHSKWSEINRWISGENSRLVRFVSKRKTKFLFWSCFFCINIPSENWSFCFTIHWQKKTLKCRAIFFSLSIIFN